MDTLITDEQCEVYNKLMEENNDPSLPEDIKKYLIDKFNDKRDKVKSIFYTGISPKRNNFYYDINEFCLIVKEMYPDIEDDWPILVAYVGAAVIWKQEV